jgi:C4-dicarboxylate transporter, DctM subunit
MVITLPILFPIITSLGFDPVWFGIIITINVEMGMITPPVGINLFVLKASIPSISMNEIVRGALPFVFLQMICMALIMIFPSLATWLPGKMMGF